MADKKEYVKLWLSYRSYFEPYSAAEVGRLVLAMMEYRASGVEPEFSGSERFVWPAIKRDIDESIQAQEAVSAARSDAGKQGGRPKAKKANAFEESKKSYGLRTKDKGQGQGKGQGQNISTEPQAPSVPPVICLPLNDGTEYPVSVEQCQEWAGLYPAVDVIQQLRAMRGWLDANTQKRKTKRGIKAFVVRWLSKEQDNGGNKPARRAPQMTSCTNNDMRKYVSDFHGGEE